MNRIYSRSTGQTVLRFFMVMGRPRRGMADKNTKWKCGNISILCVNSFEFLSFVLERSMKNLLTGTPPRSHVTNIIEISGRIE